MTTTTIYPDRAEVSFLDDDSGENKFLLRYLADDLSGPFHQVKVLFHIDQGIEIHERLLERMKEIRRQHS